jgi:DNA-binding transcriptional regulator YiaG
LEFKYYLFKKVITGDNMKNQIQPHHDKPRLTPFGDQITQARIKAGITQSEIAARISSVLGRPINGGRVSEWEQGKSVPSPEELAALKLIFP